MNETTKETIIIGCDHAGYPLKEKVKAFLLEKDFAVEDVGTNSLESVNYTDFGKKVASSVSKGEFKRGILICGTGLGMSILANRYTNVRAALCSEGFSTEMSRRHNDSNILVLGGRVIGESLAVDLVKIWTETPFDGGRHQTRIDQFENLI
ncbi:MAG: ribose 5-phosphate isomerase B [Desulfobacterales bacterium]|nr:ribose 5-phosphate isomerase B [Desulfobacterales bacterium]MCP4162314.1 ribose 5-phosphate isomerase B [Deltaproteobacteria bacterium]